MRRSLLTSLRLGQVICGIHSRVPRVYLQGGKEVKRVNHLLA